MNSFFSRGHSMYVLFICCCITNYPKFIALKQLLAIVISHNLCQSKIQLGGLGSMSHESAIRLLVKLQFSQSLTGLVGLLPGWPGHRAGESVLAVGRWSQLFAMWLLECPHNMAVGFPHSKKEKQPRLGSCDVIFARSYWLYGHSYSVWERTT